jgi:hypothetical protein
MPRGRADRGLSGEPRCREGRSRAADPDASLSPDISYQQRAAISRQRQQR